MRVDSGGCSSPLTSVYQTVTVTPTRVGERPRPLIVGPPTREKPPGALLPPLLPFSPVFDPRLPALPDLPVVVARGRSGCSGAGKRLGHSRTSRRIAHRALLCLLNQARRANGLRRLRGNARLLKAAERHSRSMVVRGFFSHVEPGGLSSLDRIRRTGYLSRAPSFACGENIGFGEGATSSPRSMMRAWMASAPHRANILTARFREVGLAAVPGTPGRARRRRGYLHDGVRHPPLSRAGRRARRRLPCRGQWVRQTGLREGAASGGCPSPPSSRSWSSIWRSFRESARLDKPGWTASRTGISGRASRWRWPCCCPSA